MAQLERARALPWVALFEVADRAHAGGRYLPTFEDFEGHVHDHSVALGLAARREAGLLALSSW